MEHDDSARYEPAPVGHPSDLIMDDGGPYRRSAEHLTQIFVRQEWEIDANHYDTTVCRQAGGTGGGTANEATQAPDDKPWVAIVIHDESRRLLGTGVSLKTSTENVVQQLGDECCGEWQERR